jgi:alkanesulfonate monooxygenase SsuD/methylene tetrahydromethanopterin reductase-like flavin-dependent oxidoreductase (luciferase family)
MVKVGVVIPSPLPAGMAVPDVPALARLAERVELDSVWFEDHLPGGDLTVLDLVALVGAAAGATERIGLGTAVFVPAFRSQPVALTQIATLQVVSGGRLELGLSLGAAREEDYGRAGLARPAVVARTDELLQVLTAAGHEGRDGSPAPFTAETFLLGTSVPVPRLWVGGTSAAALGRAARYGDGWLSGLQTVADFSTSRRQLGVLADALGRPCPQAAIVLHVAVGPGSSQELKAQSAAAMQSLYGTPPDLATTLAIGAPPVEVAEQLAPYLAAGASQLCLVSNVGPWAESWSLLAEVRRILLAHG